MLNIYDDKNFLFLEIKGIFKKSVLLDLIEKIRPYKKIILISFWHKNLRNINQISKKIKIGASFDRYSIDYLIKLIYELNLSCLVLNKRLIEDSFVNSLKIPKHYYTINNRKLFLKYENSRSLIIEYKSIR